MPSKAVVVATASLTPEPASVGLARRQLRDWCRLWCVPRETAADAVLAASELVTNALAHGRAPIWLSVAVCDGEDGLVVDVYDAASVTAALEEAITRAGAPGDASSPDGEPVGLPATGGRGLPLTAVVATRMDLVRHPRAGKTVRALFALP